MSLASEETHGYPANEVLKMELSLLEYLRQEVPNLAITSAQITTVTGSNNDRFRASFVTDQGDVLQFEGRVQPLIEFHRRHHTKYEIQGGRVGWRKSTPQELESARLHPDCDLDRLLTPREV